MANSSYIYVKINKYYTATVRTGSINELAAVLEREGDIELVAIDSKSDDITSDFLNQVLNIIDTWKNPEPVIEVAKKQLTTKQLLKKYMKAYDESYKLEQEYETLESKSHALHDLQYCTNHRQKRNLAKIAKKQQSKLNAIERKQQTRYTRMEQVEEMMTKELAEMINMECGCEMIEL